MLGNRLAVVPRAAAGLRRRTRSSGCGSCARRWRKIKQSKQVMGAEALVALNDFAPPTVLAQASRLNFSTRLFNLIVTNVPGPQFPLYVLGRELETVVPVAFLPEQARARGRDLLLQRQDELRAAGRLRRDGRHRRACARASTGVARASWSTPPRPRTRRGGDAGHGSSSPRRPSSDRERRDGAALE